MTRILLCTSGGLFGALVLRRLIASPGLKIGGIVLSTRVLLRRYGWLRGAVEQLRRSGLAYTAYLGCATSLAELLGRWNGLRSVRDLAHLHRIPLHASRDLNREDGRQFVASRKPDLLVSAFFNQRIGPEVCTLPRFGAVNIHPSLLPKYRGVDPVFYARLRGAPNLGVTVHRLTTEFDTGPILAQAVVTMDPDTSVLAATASLFERGADLLCETLPAILDEAPGYPQSAGGGYDSWPTARQVRALRVNGKRLVRLGDLVASRRHWDNS